MATSKKRVVIGSLLAVTAVGSLLAWWPTICPDSNRVYALGYAHLAELPRDIEITRYSEDGWHFVTLEFRASQASVSKWLAVSPALRSREPVIETTGDRFYPCTTPRPKDADGDTPEGDCTTVRVSKDGRFVTLHLVIPSSAYAE